MTNTVEPISREDQIKESLMWYSPTDDIPEHLEMYYEALREELDELEALDENDREPDFFYY